MNKITNVLENGSLGDGRVWHLHYNLFRLCQGGQLTTETVADISQYISINVGGSGAEYEPLSRSL